MSKYVVDTSSLITPHRTFYAFDIAPGFWKNLEVFISKEQIIILDKVRDEILEYNDELSQWIKKKKYFPSSDAINSYRKIVRWVENNNQYLQKAKDDFMSGADGWVIAYALEHGFLVVTQESSSPYSKSKIKIPDVCSVFGVRSIDVYQMLRKLQVKLK